MLAKDAVSFLPIIYAFVIFIWASCLNVMHLVLYRVFARSCRRQFERLDMNTKSDRESAKILLFPVKRRAASGSQQVSTGSVVKLAASRVVYADYGIGW